MIIQICKFIGCTVLLFSIYTCTGHSYDKEEVFIDVTESAGVQYMKESYSHCLGDINGDGLLDIYTINHHVQVPMLLINNGNGTFKDVKSNVKRWGDLHGCAIADYDNDGDQDIYVTRGAQAGKGVGLNHLYQNNGKGEFIDVAREAGVTDPQGRGRTASWVDYNNDGYLDLFVANEGRKDVVSVLFKNNGNGTFSAISIEGVTAASEASWIDYDNDGFMDLTILKVKKHRKNEISIYRNLQNETFRKTKTFYGWTYVWGDYDNDGDLDIFISNPPRTSVEIYKRPIEISSIAHIFRGFSKLYENIGDGQFIDVSDRAGFRGKMGGDKTIFFDFDNDGYLDIYILVSGTKKNNINDMIFRNNGNKTFEDVTRKIGMVQKFNGRGYGIAYGDYNNDGFLDLFLTNGKGPGYETYKESGPYVLYENSLSDNHWLKIKLVGTKSNRDGIGAGVKLYVDDQLLFRQNNGGMEGYVQHDKLIHFGLGSAAKADRIEIDWPSGHVSNMINIRADQTLVIKEN